MTAHSLCPYASSSSVTIFGLIIRSLPLVWTNTRRCLIIRVTGTATATSNTPILRLFLTSLLNRLLQLAIVASWDNSSSPYTCSLPIRIHLRLEIAVLRAKIVLTFGLVWQGSASFGGRTTIVVVIICGRVFVGCWVGLRPTIVFDFFIFCELDLFKFA